MSIKQHPMEGGKYTIDHTTKKLISPSLEAINCQNDLSYTCLLGLLDAWALIGLILFYFVPIITAAVMNAMDLLCW